MLYLAKHLTRYKYEEPVAQSLSETCLMPRVTAGQRVLRSKLDVHPEPAVFTERLDYFGNRVASFSVFRSHDQFSITATSLVEVQAPPPAWGTASLPWEQVHSKMKAPIGEEEIRASEFIFDSPYVRASAPLADFARPSFPAGRPLRQGALDLCRRIYTDFRYEPKSTSIDTPMLEVMRKRRGVCQDFAHLMVGAMRSLGLPARYVSGYLRSGTDYQGSEASHAWVSVYTPGAGWMDLDPTNNVIPSDGHLTLAWGRDYGDVPPVKGISLGGGKQLIEVEVKVLPVELSALETVNQ